MRYYWACLVQDYHPLLWATWLVAGLILVGLLACRRMKPGATAVLWFFVLAAFLTVKHPNHKSRHIHSWMAAGWAIAGAGLAAVVYGSWTRRVAPLRPMAVTAVLTSLTLAAAPPAARRPVVPDGGPRFDREPALLLAENYLPRLGGVGRAVVVSNEPVEFFARWTYLHSFRTLRGFETEIKGFTESNGANREVLNAWLKQTRCEAVWSTSTFRRAARSMRAMHLPPNHYEHLPALIASPGRFFAGRAAHARRPRLCDLRLEARPVAGR